MFNNEQNFSLKQFFTPLTTVKAVCIISIVGILVYCNSLFGAFVWDDVLQIKDNDVVHSLNNFPKFFEGSTFGLGLNGKMGGVYYKPLLSSSFSIIWSLFGAQPLFFHLFQLTLHILNAIILYLLLNTFFGKIYAKTRQKEWENLSGSQKIKFVRMYGSPVKTSHVRDQRINVLSLFLSLIFLIHPINVESVSYISALQEPLFNIFGISAFILSLKEHISMKRMSAVGFLLLCSLLSKETGVLFLFMILLYQFLYHRRRSLKFFIYELVTLSIYFFIRFVIGGVFISKPPGNLPIPIASLTFLERLANIPAIILYYLTTTLFPLKLAVQQKWVITTITIQDFYLPLLLDSVFFIALCIGGIYFYIHKRNYFNAYLFFFLWFVFGLLLTVQIFPLDMTVADRWFYFPLIGILGMLGVGLQTLLFFTNKQGGTLINYKKPSMSVAFFGVVLILLLAARTIVRNTNFHDEITLYAHDTQIQDNFSQENALGEDYVQVGNLQAALIHLQKSVNLDPYPINLFDLGNVYENIGNFQKAKKYYLLVLHNKHYNDPFQNRYLIETYTHYAQILVITDKSSASISLLKNALHDYPNDANLWLLLALAKAEQHDKQGAIAATEHANKFDPDVITPSFYQMILKNQPIILTFKGKTFTIQP